MCVYIIMEDKRLVNSHLYKNKQKTFLCQNQQKEQKGKQSFPLDFPKCLLFYIYINFVNLLFAVNSYDVHISIKIGISHAVLMAVEIR